MATRVRSYSKINLGLAIGPYAQARVLVPEGFFDQAIELLEPPDVKNP